MIMSRIAPFGAVLVRPKDAAPSDPWTCERCGAPSPPPPAWDAIAAWAKKHAGCPVVAKRARRG